MTAAERYRRAFAAWVDARWRPEPEGRALDDAALALRAALAAGGSLEAGGRIYRMDKRGGIEQIMLPPEEEG